MQLVESLSVPFLECRSLMGVKDSLQRRLSFQNGFRWGSVLVRGRARLILNSLPGNPEALLQARIGVWWWTGVSQVEVFGLPCA